MKKFVLIAFFIFVFLASTILVFQYADVEKVNNENPYIGDGEQDEVRMSHSNTVSPQVSPDESPVVSPPVSPVVRPTVSSQVSPLLSSTPSPTVTPVITPTTAVESPYQPELVEKEELIELIKLDDSFVLDIKYATEDNFTGKVIYKRPICLIHKETAKKLIAANNEFKKMGLRLKIFDAYRPFSAQQVLWDAAEDKSFVANPSKGSIHNRGAAVDVTLVDQDGNELEMPSGYDEFTKRARLNYTDCPPHQVENRELLGKIMVKHGFKRISNEWWHFEDTNAKNYPILDISLEEFDLEI